jgi:hypothetical protein
LLVNLAQHVVRVLALRSGGGHSGLFLEGVQ